MITVLITVLILSLGFPPTLRADDQILTAPELFHALRRAGEDDPRAALADAQRQLAKAPDAATRFWLQLAIGRMHLAQEDDKAAKEAFSKAESTLASVPGASAHMALWLQLESTPTIFDSLNPQQFGSHMLDLRAKVNKIGDAVLTCSATGWELWGLVSTKNYDEAWLSAEELERCSHSKGPKYLEAMALDAMALIKARTTLSPSATQEVLGFYDRALAALDDGSARWRRSAIEWDMGNELLHLKQFVPALAHLQRSLALCKAIDDRGGIALAQMSIAHVLLEQGSFEEMLPVLDEAQTLLESFDNGARMPELRELRVLALARLRRLAVLEEIRRARLLDQSTAQPGEQAALARALAEGYASQAQYQRAYVELLRANELETAGKSLVSDTQVLRLQARYDAVRRDAENAELRHRSETDRLALSAQVAERQLFWVAIAALALFACSAAYFGRREQVRGRELRVARESADEANRAKSRFLAAASHDLRQPMHALNLYLGMLTSGSVQPADGATYLARAQACGSTMEEMFRAFLDISKLDADAVKVRTETFSVAELFRQLNLEFEPQAREKGIALTFVSSSLLVVSDMELVTNILRNILGNALRYTTQGRILVGCRRSRSTVKIAVFDTGCGIPEDVQPHIFDEFFRGNGRAQHHGQGLGLGLAISKRLAGLLGIPLTFASRPGRGSVFAIEVPRAEGTLPMGDGDPVARLPQLSTDISGALVVVVDDDPQILEVMHAGLAALGCEVLAAQSTEEALTLLAATTRVPDVLLCDHRLGKTELGLATVAAIRDEFAAEIPAIIITGDTGSESLARIAASGLPVLHKPLQWEQLKQAIFHCYSRH